MIRILFMLLESLSQPVIFAHRGASAYAPENTIAAFELALTQQADAIELDAKLSKDGQVVVIHDPTVDRTTNGHGNVADLSLAQLKALDSGSFFSEAYRGERIPTLEEVLEAVGKRTMINIELTNYTTPHDSLVETVCMLIKKHKIQERVFFSSFHASNLNLAYSYLPDVPRGLLTQENMRGWWMRSFGFAFGDYQALHPWGEDVSPQQVARVHRLKRRVHVYTINLVEKMRTLFRWGVDGIFTDDPQLAISVRAEST